MDQQAIERIVSRLVDGWSGDRPKNGTVFVGLMNALTEAVAPSGDGWATTAPATAPAPAPVPQSKPDAQPARKPPGLPQSQGLQAPGSREEILRQQAAARAGAARDDAEERRAREAARKADERASKSGGLEERMAKLESLVGAVAENLERLAAPPARANPSELLVDDEYLDEQEAIYVPRQAADVKRSRFRERVAKGEHPQDVGHELWPRSVQPRK